MINKRLQVSVVIPTYNRRKKLTALLDSINKSNFDRSRLEIIVVDNASTDDTENTLLLEYSEIVLLKLNRNYLSAFARNVGANAAKGDYIFFIDDDNILHEDCILKLFNALEADASMGIAGPIMLKHSQKDVIWCAGAVIGFWGIPKYILGDQKFEPEKLNTLIEDIDYFPNAYMVKSFLIRGGVSHDEIFFPHNWAETDFAYKIKKKGYKLSTITKALTWHDYGITNGMRVTRINIKNSYDQARSRIIFRKIYLNGFLQQLAFWLITFPISTVIYFIAFFRNNKKEFMPFVKIYLKGTWDGFKIRI